MGRTSSATSIWKREGPHRLEKAGHNQRAVALRLNPKDKQDMGWEEEMGERQLEAPGESSVLTLTSHENPLGVDLGSA